jgi:hypothetical protein
MSEYLQILQPRHEFLSLKIEVIISAKEKVISMSPRLRKR